MNEATAKTYADFIVPPAIVSKLDLARLIAEVERIDNTLTADAIRVKAGGQPQPTPVVSEQLIDFLQQNQLTLAPDGHTRAAFITQLRLLKDKAPVIHMTFAVAADRESLQELAKWVRSSVHPQAVIVAGLQPALVAGMYMRTPNHVHDFSLRAMLNGKHDMLVKDLEALRGRN